MGAVAFPWTVATYLPFLPISQELAGINSKYLSASDEASNLKTELQDTKGLLESTKSSLQNTESLLETIKNELYETQQELSELKGELSITTSELSESERNLLREQTLTIGNTLQDHYNEIRELYNMASMSNAQKAEFLANLAKHDNGLIYWPNIANEYYQKAGSHCYDDARAKLSFVIGDAGYLSSDLLYTQIKKILDWVNTYINYESEFDDIYRAPVETLALKSGDCDDYSALVSALFKRVGIHTAVGLFINKNTGGRHVMVLIHYSDLGGYGYSYFNDLTVYGLESGRWIVIEPQRKIETQGQLSISEYSLYAVHEV